MLQRRGGYCFELNVMFGWLLDRLGYDLEFRLGRVWLRDPELVPPRNHGTHIVHFKDCDVIADVGFGGRAPRRPLDISMLDVQQQDGDAKNEPVRIVEAGEFGIMVQRYIDNSWSNQFSLEDREAHVSDLDVANHFQATSPSSQFKHHLFVGVFRDDGRDGLFDTRLSNRRGAETVIQNITNVDQLIETLDATFNIDPSGHEEALAKIIETSL